MWRIGSNYSLLVGAHTGVVAMLISVSVPQKIFKQMIYSLFRCIILGNIPKLLVAYFPY